MAQKTTVVLIDDLDGESEAAESVAFALDGTSYLIDLSVENAAALRDAFAPYVAAARKAGGSRRGRPPARRAGSGQSDGPSADQVREWARANGHKVNERGRISAAVREAYEAAQA